MYLRRRLATVAAVAAAATLWLGLAAPAATANNTADPEPAGEVDPSAEPMEYDPRWIPVPGAGLEDGRGIELWRYDMFLNDDESLKLGNHLAGGLVRSFWGTYRVVTALSIWVIDWVLGFSWLSFLATPVTEIGASLQQLMTRLGLVPVLLTLTAFICGLWILRGRWALGLYEVAVAAVMVSLAAGALANPVALVTGPDGYIMGSRDIGFQIADSLANGREPYVVRETSTGGEEVGPVLPRADRLQRDQTERLIDTLIRGPHQALNFGTVLDGTECEDRYDDLLRSNPVVDVDRGLSFWDSVSTPLGEIWAMPRRNPAGHALAECDPVAMAPADNPSFSQVSTAFIIAPGAAVILLFAILLAGAVLVAGVNVLFQSLKAIITVVTAVLPGRARGALWRTVADVLVSLIIMIFAIVFLTAYLIVVDTVLRTQEDVGAATTFIVVDIVLLAGLIVFWRGRRSLQRASEQLAQVFAARPGGSPTRLPEAPTWGQDLRRKTRRVAGLAGLSTYGMLRLRRHSKSRRRGGGGSGSPAAANGRRPPGQPGGSGQAVPPPTAPMPATSWVFGPRRPTGQAYPRPPGPTSAARAAVTDGRPFVADPAPTRGEIGRGWRSAGPARRKLALPPGPAGGDPGAGGPSGEGDPPPGRGRVRGLGRRLMRAGARMAASVATGGGSTAVAEVAAAARARREGVVGRLREARTAPVNITDAQPSSRLRTPPPAVRRASMPEGQARAGQYQRVVKDGQVLYVPPPRPPSTTHTGTTAARSRKARQDKLRAELAARATGRKRRTDREQEK